MGSASQPMLVVKANRALLKKRRTFKDLRTSYEGYVGDTQLHFKELTPFEQKKIKDKIRAQAKQDRLREIGIYFASLFAMCLLFLGIYLLVSS